MGDLASDVQTTIPTRWSPQRSTLLSSKSTRRSGSDISPTDSSVCLQHGENQRVSTAEFEDGLRARWSCHRLVLAQKKTRHMMPSGHKAFLVHNPKDVKILLMHNRTYAAEIASAASSRKRVEIVAKAKALGVKVTNGKAKITTES